MNQSDQKQIDIDFLNFACDKFIDKNHNIIFEYLEHLNNEQIKIIFNDNINIINNLINIKNLYYDDLKNIYFNIDYIIKLKEYFKIYYNEDDHKITLINIRSNMELKNFFLCFIRYFENQKEILKNDFIKYNNQKLLQKIEEKKEFKEINKKRKI